MNHFPLTMPRALTLVAAVTASCAALVAHAAPGAPNAAVAPTGQTGPAADAPPADAPPPGSVPVPHLDPAQTITPAQDIYPDVSLAAKQVDEAFKSARKTHRKVLLDFGGNWCPDCRKLGGVFDVPSVAQWLDSEFVVVPVNVGRINQNLDIAARYGVTIHEVPTVLILTADGKALNTDGANTLGNARAMSAQSVIDLIDGWNRRG